MPTVFSIPEVQYLAKYGVFTLVHVSGVIPAGTAAPVQVRMAVPTNWKIITSRFNFGATTIAIPAVVEYELYNEEGFYCGEYIGQANINNTCTHLKVARWIEAWFYNRSDPAMDVAYEFAAWYYTFPDWYEQDIYNLMWTISNDEAELMYLLRAMNTQLASEKQAGPSPPLTGVRR